MSKQGLGKDLRWSSPGVIAVKGVPISRHTMVGMAACSPSRVSCGLYLSIFSNMIGDVSYPPEIGQKKSC